MSTRIAALTGALMLAGGAILAPAATPAAQADNDSVIDVDDFVIESFHAEYTLGRDAEGRSTLRTLEHIVAVFPDFDQNRGLIRDIPRRFNGHDTGVTVLGVTDEAGSERDFETEHYGDFLAVTIAVPEGDFVHGMQHYVIEYTQRDVTRYFENTGADEFYWNVNGTEWAQPFGSISARLTLEDGLEAGLNGNASCYRGALGSVQGCEIRREDHGFSVSETMFGPGENVTVAIGFEPSTFAPAPEPFLQRFPLQLWGAFTGLAATLGVFLTALFSNRNARTGRPIIAQYEPPEGVSVAAAAHLLRVPKKAMTATLLDFAVRRKLRVLRNAEVKQFGVQAIDATQLLPSEARGYARLFTGKASQGVQAVPPGKTIWFTRKNTELGDAAATVRSEAFKETQQRGLFQKPKRRHEALVTLLSVLAVGLVFVHALVIDNEPLLILTLFFAIGVLPLLVTGMHTAMAVPRRTEKGALLFDHLQGLREFIRLAEADRIRMLQSARGAEVSEDFVVHLYERLLPYAVLFGFEKQWQTELAKHYRESSPDWVRGSGTFDRVLPLGSFTRMVSRAPTTRAASSSGRSGGGVSSGGGSSGGGGGGGGGRGI